MALLDYANSAQTGSEVFVDKALVTRYGLAPLGLHEVGVTDAVLSCLWRYGPVEASYAVSSGAEGAYLGADIAFVDLAGRRILLYQAKLAHLAAGQLELKSRVPQHQAAKLSKGSAVVDGTTFTTSGRLAIYQTGHTSHIHRWPTNLGWMVPSQPGWWAGVTPSIPEVPSTLAGTYYESVLRRQRCSSSGVLAAPVRPKPTGPILSVPARETWPWEFDFIDWWTGSGWLDLFVELAGDLELDSREIPFPPFETLDEQVPQVEQSDRPDPGEFTEALKEALDLPASRSLTVVLV